MKREKEDEKKRDGEKKRRGRRGMEKKREEVEERKRKERRRLHTHAYSNLLSYPTTTVHLRMSINVTSILVLLKDKILVFYNSIYLTIFSNICSIIFVELRIFMKV